MLKTKPYELVSPLVYQFLAVNASSDHSILYSEGLVERLVLKPLFFLDFFILDYSFYE